MAPRENLLMAPGHTHLQNSWAGPSLEAAYLTPGGGGGGGGAPSPPKCWHSCRLPEAADRGSEKRSVLLFPQAGMGRKLQLQGSQLHIHVFHLCLIVRPLQSHILVFNLCLRISPLQSRCSLKEIHGRCPPPPSILPTIPTGSAEQTPPRSPPKHRGRGLLLGLSSRIIWRGPTVANAGMLVAGPRVALAVVGGALGIQAAVRCLATHGEF